MATSLTSRAALYVEFLGLPGSGKSTLAHAVAGVLRAEGVRVSEPSYVLTHRTPAPLRQAAKLTHAALGSLRHPLETIGSLCTTLRSGQRSARMWGALSLNWLYILRLVRRRAGGAGVHLFDQGLLQAWWSLAYEARAPVLSAGRAVLRKCWPSGAVVVLVEAGPVTAGRRLSQRPGFTSRVERDLHGGRWLESVARSSTALRQMEILARRLARRDGTTLLRIDNDADGSLVANAAALARTLETLHRARSGPPAEGPVTRPHA